MLHIELYLLRLPGDGIACHQHLSSQKVSHHGMQAFVAAGNATTPTCYHQHALTHKHATLGRYMLGDGPRSFVVGYGKAPPVRPHHRAASCPAMPLPCNESALHAGGPNPHVLVGALVGGPTRLEAYPDDRADYVTSEVGIDAT